ncbi:MAG: sigma-70 family RNA polymerase sigma factor [Chloroflexi bacterium]|nr:sigma-70 family RNA polymerase sigma factor [Chloroflexota bacterium]
MLTPGLTDSDTTGASTAVPRRLKQFSERYNEYFPRVFAYIYARVHNVHVTEDLVADVFERAFVKANTLRNSDAFSTWLFTIARNVIISNGRKLNRETIVDPDILKEIAPSSASVEGEVISREDVRTIAMLLHEFPQREQDIVALKFDAELPNAQIAKIMDVSEVNIRVILFRTLRKLRELMTAHAGS